jgi:enterochelin esterase family protein
MKKDGLEPFELKSFNFKTLIVNSKALAQNPLADPTARRQFILSPKNLRADTPVVFCLSGYGSDAWKNFSFAGFDSNLAQDLDLWTQEKQIPEALYIFVNSWTKWGGSQFINSVGSGRYEDYIIQDLIPEFQKDFPEVADTKNWVVMGGSSGGYGALSLGSKYPDLFPYVVALAPDSLFDVSLLPEIYKYLPYIQEHGGIKSFIKAYEQGLIKVNHDILFGLLNLIAMTHSYALQNTKGDLQFPITLDGELDVQIWQSWLRHDPVQFLSARSDNLKKLKALKIFTGDKDEYGLQFGSRQIYKSLKAKSVNIEYTELHGTHRSLKHFRNPALISVFQAIKKSNQ